MYRFVYYMSKNYVFIFGKGCNINLTYAISKKLKTFEYILS